ncbi:ThuA domain-containing protein [Solirubrobacter sp. CPCC 204708]|uniref:ThuA domain-containing protein n=1 Tax=Solirubrobacter deserti TaxID=2282478 RepID=A0ABT4RDW7_9ACTN|nr:ThuA domain-containing protein [Solirubrobacter deserti]MBE2315964.1 ThuA domain-containing protein [Solirubrobacter deserti]MDA0136715.1 ThuA domain-containing protein [Solirubrobacter deserti]
MGRRSWGLAFASLALALPATASAKEVEPYKVLVVTSTSDATSTAGINAITSAVGTDGVVEAPAPAEVGAKFTPEGLDAYRAVVFLNTGQASPLSAAQRTNFENYYKDGGGLVAIGSAIETDESWQFLTDALGTRAKGRAEGQAATVKVIDRVHDATKALPQYWDRSEGGWYSFTANVRGKSHVLASVVEDPFGPQPQGKVLNGVDFGANAMGADHPISWCKDFQNGRSFYTGLGTNAAAFDENLGKHLKGAIAWAAGQSDPEYSDCGATVLTNYQQTKIAAPPNVGEPIGFHRLDDGRIIQTLRSGQVRVHDPEAGTTKVVADFQAASTPSKFRLYTVSEDGLYGPAVDNNFAQNKYLYLYYSPLTVENVKLSTGQVVTQTTPIANAPNANQPQPSLAAWDPWVGYFQLSRFKLVEDAQGNLTMDFNSEEQIMRVPQNRGQCCHVGGDIVFDKNNVLITGTGDDNEAGGVNGGGFGPYNDQLADEQQTIRIPGATGGTFTLTFEGQTTAPIPFNATNDQVDAALEALEVLAPDEVQASGSLVFNAQTNPNPAVNVFFRRARAQKNQPQMTLNTSNIQGGSAAPSLVTTHEGGYFFPPTSDARRTALNTNDLRGKILRIKVKETAIPAADFNKADYGSGAGAYTIPEGNLFPLVGGAPQAKTRPEVHSMGFRNPFRVDVDSDGVIYTTDYSPDSQTARRGRGPAGVGRYEIVRKPSNYGWPTCYSSKLGYWEWEFSEFTEGTTSAGRIPLTGAKEIECGGPTQKNDAYMNLNGGPSVEPGLVDVPPVTDPDIWYSYQDNPNLAGTNPRPVGAGTPCQAGTQLTPGPNAPLSTTECPRLFPELFDGGVAPHGMAKYEYNADNPSAVKFPPYYDDSVIIAEFGRNTMREVKLDGENHIQKINPFLDCGAVNPANPPMFECDAPMDLAWGKDGAFYLLTYGNGFFSANFDAGMYKWEYVKGARAPKAVLSADKTDGGVPLTVNFSSAGSGDPDAGDSVRYEWDFGDDSPISEEANPTHTFTKAGQYTVVLKVTDSTGKTASTSTIITAGNTAATITIKSPYEGGVFTFGDRIPYVVEVTDPEDERIDCNDVEVEFILGHDEHGHGEEEKLGCSGFLTTLAEDVSHGGNVFGVISATYTDKGNGTVPGITVNKQVKIRQAQQELEHATQSFWVPTATNDEGGGLHVASIGANAGNNPEWLRLNGPFNLRDVNGISFRYADQGARAAGSVLNTVRLHTGSQNGPIVASFNLTAVGTPDVWRTQSFPLPKLDGLNELFLTVTNSNTTALNWVKFDGPGVSRITAPPVDGTVGGSVPATLALSLSGTPSLGVFTPGVDQTYSTEVGANVISTAGDARLSVSDAGPNPGHLVNGAFVLPKPLKVGATSTAGTGTALTALGAAATSVLTYNGPVTNDQPKLQFSQEIGRTDPLRTGNYSKTLTFTLSTTTP